MNILKMSEEEIVTIANPIWDNLVDGGNRLDYSTFSKDFSRRMLNLVPKEELEKQHRDDPTDVISKERIFLGIIRRINHVTVLWKLRNKNDVNERLARMSLGEEDGKIKVFDAQIQPK